MNYAALYKARVVDNTFDELAAYVTHPLKRQRFRGMQELNFYYSSVNVQEFYTCSLWLRLEDLEAVKAIPLDNLLPEQPQFKSTLLEEDTFRLLWEHQYLTTPVEISTIRPMTFPPDYPEEKFMHFARTFRKSIQGVKGLRGAWVGRSLNNQRRLLIRVDWASLEEWQELANEDYHKKAHSFYAERGIITEFGSSRWASNLKYEYSNIRQQRSD